MPGVAQREPQPAVYFLEHLCTPLAFPKANPQPLQSSPGGGRHQDKLPQSPWVTPQSSEHQHLPNSSSWFGGDAAQSVQSIPKNIPWSRECGCHSPVCPRNNGVAPDVCRAPANTALTRVWVPSFLPSSRNPSDFTFAQTSKATPAAPGFALNQAQRQPSLQVRGKGS